MGSTVDIASSFIEGAPPSELADVVKDIKALTSDDEPDLIAKLKPAFQKYNEEQLVAVKLPGASDYVCVSIQPSSRLFDTLSRLGAHDYNQLGGDTSAGGTYMNHHSRTSCCCC